MFSRPNHSVPNPIDCTPVFELLRPMSSTVEEFEFVEVAPGVPTFVDPNADIYLASRIGDVKRVEQLLTEHGVDVNKRDVWDSVPLYYACLTGHLEVVRCLLDHGAVCNEYTFDGDRCHYASLNLAVRELLREYETRPPLLGPLATCFRDLCKLCENPEQVETDDIGEKFPDLELGFEGESYLVHKAVLASRFPYFEKALSRQEGGERRDVQRVVLLPGVQTKTVLESLLVYAYTERVDLDMDHVIALRRMAKHFKCKSLVEMIDKELISIRYYFKTTRREDAPRRFILHPSAFPDSATLGHDLGNLRTRMAAWEECMASDSSPDHQDLGDDFADVVLRVGDRMFRAHKCILCCRSDYFRRILDPATGTAFSILSEIVWPEGCGRKYGLLDLHDMSPESVNRVLHFIYTNAILPLPSWYFTSANPVADLFDACDRLLVFQMKKPLCEHLVPGLHNMSVELACQLLLVADMYSANVLRDHCLAEISRVLDAVISDKDGSHDQDAFKAFVVGVAPRNVTDEEALFDGSHLRGEGHGTLDGTSVAGQGFGTLLQDLRETYLQLFGGEDRDFCAQNFDKRFYEFAVNTIQEHEACD